MIVGVVATVFTVKESSIYSTPSGITSVKGRLVIGLSAMFVITMI